MSQTTIQERTENINVERVLRIVSAHEDDFSTTLEMAYGINDWFREYLATDRYASLSAEDKKDAFDNHMMIKDFLSSLYEQLPQNPTL